MHIYISFDTYRYALLNVSGKIKISLHNLTFQQIFAMHSSFEEKGLIDVELLDIISLLYFGTNLVN